MANEKGRLAGLKVQDLKSNDIKDLQVTGLFFAIGHEPASKFLKGQLKSDADGYILTTPGSTKTTIDGVYAAGDVQDKKLRQAITAAGTGESSVSHEDYVAAVSALPVSVYIFVQQFPCTN